MKEARYIIRLSNDRPHTPGDQAKLLQTVRECVRPLGGQAMNLRVSHRALEFDVFFPEDREIKPFLTALQRVGSVLNWKRLDLPPGRVEPAKVIAEAKSLFNEERYWETHEVLEGLWKQTQGPERELLQGWILVAAALVHVQKNELKVVRPMLQDAARRLENKPADYYGWDVRKMLTQVYQMITQQTWDFPTI